ncbi:hypothetical protein [Flavobacterium inviolabile]|uniref:hypothetical protein n=1 Tax=Flavobacterium inviolabile TaxID=2748320 RepID=UPI0015ABB490|nr:hypothetical protein [Flavobacterium inviolabile]
MLSNISTRSVYVLYVYDALLCEEKDKTVVMETMNRIILEHGVKTCVKDTSPKIDVDCSIVGVATKGVNEAEAVTMDTNTKRITIDEFFKRFRIKYGNYVTETSLDISYDILSNDFDFIDEVTEEYKTMCVVET